jgi:hypothetical protein
MDLISGREAETNRQATVKIKVIGPKMSFSAVLVEAMFPRVLKAINIVMIQETTLMKTGIRILPTSPARSRITKMNAPKSTAAMMLEILKEAVNCDCLPPQAIEIGRIPTASII